MHFYFAFQVYNINRGLKRFLFAIMMQKTFFFARNILGMLKLNFKDDGLLENFQDCIHSDCIHT